MAKKKLSKGPRKSGGSGMLWALAAAVVVIFVLVAQLQEKDRKLEQYRKPSAAEKQESSNLFGGTDYVVKSHKPALDKEKLKKLVETNIDKLSDRAKEPGKSWFVDEVAVKNDVIKISFEDGAMFYSVTYKIIDPNNCSTWIRQ